MRVLIALLVLLLGACGSAARSGPSEPSVAVEPVFPIDVEAPEPDVVRPWAVNDGVRDRFMPDSPAVGLEPGNRDPGFAPLPGPVAPRRR